MSTLIRRLPILFALAASWAPLLSQAPAVDLKKWPKGDPMEYVLLKDEKALYKRLATDEERRKFIDFAYARRSTAQLDFRKVLAAVVDKLNQQFEVKHEDGSTHKETVVFRGWETDPGRLALLLGLPDSAEESKAKEATYVFHYKRKLGAMQPPAEFEFKRVEQAYMGDFIKLLRYNSSFPASVWESTLAPAAADWDSFKVDPASVLLKECVPLTPMLCAPQRAPEPPTAAGETGAPADVKVATGGKLTDFSELYPETGSIAFSLTANYLPTQVAGDTEIRIVLAAEGEAFTGKARLLPAEGSAGTEQDFTEADFKAVSLKGKNFLEARRSVKAGDYVLVGVALRGGEFGRKAMPVRVSAFNPGSLTIAVATIAERTETVADGAPLSIGTMRVIPVTGEFKSGDTFSPVFVVYGAVKTGGYSLKATITYRLTAGATRPADAKKLNFKKGENVLEAPAGSLSSTSPLIVGELAVPPAPPAATVTTGGKSEQIPLRWTNFKVRAVIEDLNAPGGSVTTDWFEIPLAK